MWTPLLVARDFNNCEYYQYISVALLLCYSFSVLTREGTGCGGRVLGNLDCAIDVFLLV